MSGDVIVFGRDLSVSVMRLMHITDTISVCGEKKMERATSELLRAPFHYLMSRITHVNRYPYLMPVNKTFTS